MSTPVKLIGFLAVLAAVFGLAHVTGAFVGPIGEPAASAHQDDHTPTAAPPSGATATVRDLPGGLMVSQNGFTFALTDAVSELGENVPVRFTITGPSGEPVTEYDVQHDKDLHLIAVRRDFVGFQHVHPTLGADGIWSVDLDLTAGQWRLFADFKASGAEPLTLGTDLLVHGAVSAPPPSVETRTAQIDGYTVTLTGKLTPGAEAILTLSVSHDGEPVTDLQPYLAAYGHLVALREGDLAYLHVHPDGAPGDGTTPPGPEIVFHTSIPSTGIYHLYLDFQHHGVVRTAEFTVHVTEAAPGSASRSNGHEFGN